MTRENPSDDVRGQDANPFHEGELAVQEATGERAAAARLARMLSTSVPLAPAHFLAEQRMVVLSSMDEAGAPWASLVFGEEGFVTVPSPEVLVIDRRRAQIASEDALRGNLRAGAMLGILAIELSSRRRYRVNGFVSFADEDRIEIAVREAYVNCPKYIQRRNLREQHDPALSPGAGPLVASGTSLDAERRARIARADTMFVASRHPSRGADASHRGGEPGFLEIRDERTIRVPEYSGNGLYNTLGNLVVASEAGLAIVDFEGGRVIQLTGAAKVVLEAAPPAGEGRAGSARGAAAETGRYWDFLVSRWTEFALPKVFRWELVDRSPFNPHPHP